MWIRFRVKKKWTEVNAIFSGEAQIHNFKIELDSNMNTNAEIVINILGQFAFNDREFGTVVKRGRKKKGTLTTTTTKRKSDSFGSDQRAKKKPIIKYEELSDEEEDEEEEEEEEEFIEIDDEDFDKAAVGHLVKKEKKNLEDSVSDQVTKQVQGEMSRFQSFFTSQFQQQFNELKMALTTSRQKDIGFDENKLDSKLELASTQKNEFRKEKDQLDSLKRLKTPISEKKKASHLESIFPTSTKKKENEEITVENEDKTENEEEEKMEDEIEEEKHEKQKDENEEDEIEDEKDGNFAF